MLKMVLAAVALASLISTGASAAELTADMTTTESPIATRGERHSIRIGSEKVRYTASFAETLLRDENGRPQASISATTYLREGVEDAHRPVVFAFNGGPGASSSPLHFGALGPRVWMQRGSSRELVDNADSLLDVADLVFIDPVGTGFSRLRPGGDPDRYWSIEGDAAAAADFIHDWLRDHGRSDAPVFIAGESYGGFRLATMAPRLNDLHVAGLIFVSPMLDASASAGAPGNDLPFVFELPTLAAAAWYHQKIDRAGRSVEQFYDEAARFAQSEYLVALQQGSTLPDAARKQIAARMSQLIGLPAEAIEASNLRMDSEQFLRTLLADKNLLVGRLDVRVTAPKPAAQDPNRPPAADDPALGLKGSNVIRSELIKNYLREEVGVNTARDYLSLTLDVNFRWNWQTTDRGPRFYINPTTNLAALMQKQPQARLLLLGGYYDLATPLLAPRHALSHAQLPWDKVTVAAFDAGHSPFEGEGNRSRVVQVVRAFVTQEPDAAATLPVLSVTLEPHSSHGRVDYVDGSVTIGSPRVAAGGTLVRMPLVIVSIPTARYDGDALKASDARGELRLTQKDEEPTPTGTYRQWLASRATSGDVTIKFRAPPRVITPTTRTGPLFDLRADGGGVLGAGITFIPLPDSKQPYRLSLRWDLGEMPAGSRGVGSLGDGNVDTIGPPERLAFSFYAAGPMKSVPTAGSNDFGMYWFSDLPFDATALASSIEQLYGYMAKFFRDEGQPYRVFIRKNVNRLGGGTALPQSFMFGWNEEKSPTIEQLQSLLAHEMTHNWPALQGDHGDTAWYSEGAAEFYSTILSSRAGVLSPSQTLEEINRHAFDYYTNPYLHSSNREVAKVFWTDWSAQRVPYGRGFMYLAQVDAQIRERSGGRRSLDDIVVELFRQKKAGKVPGIDEWLRLVQAELGERAQSDYDAMVAGRVIVPPPNTFAPCFKPVTDRARPFALGLSSTSFSGERKVVEGLVPGSPAAAAGLREGDEIVEFTDPLEVQKEPGMHMKIKVRRDGQEISIDYLPRGPEIEIYRWQRAAGVSDANCKV